jgi:uncharacterized protein YfaQ (DUF2300 family)
MDTEKTFKTRFQGRLIECKPLVDGQMLVVKSMFDTTAEVDPEDTEAVKVAQEAVARDSSRLMRILESRVGPKEWALIDDGMVMGTVTLAELFGLLVKVLNGSTGKADPA